MERLAELDDWIEEHRCEISECPATTKGYRRAVALNWGLQQLLEYRQTLLPTPPASQGE